MPTAEDELRKIGKHIAYWIAEIGEANAQTFYDINKVSEGIAQQLLNLVFDYQLRDLNAGKKNYPGIDLGDEGFGGTAFQVTSRNDRSKIIEDLNTFRDKDYGARFPNGLKFFIIGNERKKIKLSIQEPHFNPETDILYAQELRKFIQQIYYEHPKRFERIRDFLQREFPLYTGKSIHPNITPVLSGEDHKTAIIVLKIDKLREKYRNCSNDWLARRKILNKLYKYADHSNEHIAARLFPFLYDYMDIRMERHRVDKAEIIRSLLLEFLPSSLGNGNEMGIENGRQACSIGHDLAYDGFIHVNNFRIAELGFFIMKHVYVLGRRHQIPALLKVVHDDFDYLEGQLMRKNRPDLADARELFAIFKADLDRTQITTPIMPQRLFALMVMHTETGTSL